MDSRMRRMGLSEIRPRATISTRGSGGFALLLYEFPSGRSISAIGTDNLVLEAIGYGVHPSLARRKITPASNIILETRIVDIVDICKELGKLEAPLGVLHSGIEVYFAIMSRKTLHPQACVTDGAIDEVDCGQWVIPFLIEEKEPYPLWVGGGVEGVRGSL